MSYSSFIFPKQTQIYLNHLSLLKGAHNVASGKTDPISRSGIDQSQSQLKDLINVLQKWTLGALSHWPPQQSQWLGDLSQSQPPGSVTSSSKPSSPILALGNHQIFLFQMCIMMWRKKKKKKTGLFIIPYTASNLFRSPNLSQWVYKLMAFPGELGLGWTWYQRNLSAFLPLSLSLSLDMNKETCTPTSTYSHLVTNGSQLEMSTDTWRII